MEFVVGSFGAHQKFLRDATALSAGRLELTSTRLTNASESSSRTVPKNLHLGMEEMPQYFL
jgi:hypothetical protein